MLEAVISTDAGVDWDELLVKGSKETIPVGGMVLPVSGLVIGSPP
jgi:hypothetical protein